MDKNYILVVDAGTTSTRALLFDKEMKVCALESKELGQIHPQPTHVEQDPKEIVDYTIDVIRKCVQSSGISKEAIRAVGLTFQRGPWLFWDQSGQPLCNAISWMDTRAQFGRELLFAMPGFRETFPEHTMYMELNPRNYNIAQIVQLKKEDPAFAEAMKKPGVKFGYVDSWLIYNLTGGKKHLSDTSFNGELLHPVKLIDYDYDVLPFLEMRTDMLPKLTPSIYDFGVLDEKILGLEIPIVAAIGDQQSALFAQGCHEAGTAKCTLGTGAFFDLNTGKEPKFLDGFMSMVAWQIGNAFTYSIEGTNTSAGACLKWAKETFRMFDSYDELNQLAEKVPDSNGVYFVPAINGMASPPFYNSNGRASFMGMTSSAATEHFCRALLESLGFVCATLFDNAMGDAKMSRICVDGGASRSNITCQTLADISGATVVRPTMVEATAMGAGEMAAIACDWYTVEGTKDILASFGADIFKPNPDNKNNISKRHKMWLKACERSKDWLEHE